MSSPYALGPGQLSRQVLVESIKLFFHDCGQLNHWRKWWPVYGIASLGVLAFFTESNPFESILSTWMVDACDLSSFTHDQQLNITFGYLCNSKELQQDAPPKFR